MKLSPVTTLLVAGLASAAAKKAKSSKFAATNVCAGEDPGFAKIPCIVDGVVKALGQAGADVTVGYVGGMEVGDLVPITVPFYEKGLCPVNVHWHLGAEHRSEGEYDEEGTGPHNDPIRRKLEGDVQSGLRCHHYRDDEWRSKFTKEYDWKHCKDMEVGETYEVHWPHSRAGACGTLNQWQTPFQDGVFCLDKLSDNLQNDIGVQSQVFTVVNNEAYYFANLMRGMVVDEELGMGVEVTKYTGSTTGASHNNEVCSQYAPITWQVDRKCHKISASSFDKMCADMAKERDDMSDDYHPHGARELVDHELAANNQVNRHLTVTSNFVY